MKPLRVKLTGPSQCRPCGNQPVPVLPFGFDRSWGRSESDCGLRGWSADGLGRSYFSAEERVNDRLGPVAVRSPLGKVARSRELALASGTYSRGHALAHGSGPAEKPYAEPMPSLAGGCGSRSPRRLPLKGRPWFASRLVREASQPEPLVAVTLPH